MLVGSSMLFGAFMEGEIATPKSKLTARMVTVESNGSVIYDLTKDAEAGWFKLCYSHHQSPP